MKVIQKLVILALMLFSIISALLFMANKGDFNSGLKTTLQYYFFIKGYKSEITNLKFKDGRLRIDEITLRHKNNSLKLEKIEGLFDAEIYKLKLVSNLRIDEVNIDNLEKNIICLSSIKIATDFTFGGGSKTLQIDIENFNMSEIKSHSGFAEIKYKELNGDIKVFSRVRFSETSFFDAKIDFKKDDKINSKISLQNIPIQLTTVAYSLFPNDEILYFFSSSFPKGNIRNGEYQIALPGDFFKNGKIDESNLYGTFEAEGVEYIYDYNLPPVKNMDISAKSVGLITEFAVGKAVVADFNINNCQAKLDLTQPKKEIFTIRGKAKGPTNGLIKFISDDVLNKLKKAKIDLTKFSNSANVNILIDVPLQTGTKNHLDISADIPNTALSIFDGKINMQRASLSGNLSDVKLVVNGKAFINNYLSVISFEHNFAKDSEFKHKLKITSNIKKLHPDKSQEKIGFISVLDGSTQLEFEHFYKDNIGYLKFHSDLKNIDLYFDKLGIHKKKGEDAILTSNGILTSDEDYEFKFNLNGSNNLRVDGDIKIQSDSFKVTIPILKHNKTDLKARIDCNKNNFITRIEGDVLDLERADMLSFLEKEIEGGKASTKLVANIKSIKLKEDITLDDLELKVMCDGSRCYDGNISANLGARALDMRLEAIGDSERWEINVPNAGAILRGIGAYNAMKAGSLHLIINTSRKSIKPGEIIPVRQGQFKFEKFILSDTPTLSRLVSFVSLPGFLNMLTNNKDLVFSKMSGEFTFDKGILQIKDAFAEGPFFNFSMNGAIEINNRNIDLKGYVTPSLYGFSSIVKNIPLLGNMLIMNKNNRGLISAPYKIKQAY